MKYLIPVFVGVATITAAVTTALAQAHGAFNGRVPLTPYLYGYGSAIILVAIAAVMAVRTARQEKPTPHPPVQHTEQLVAHQANPRQEQHVYIGGDFLRQLRENAKTAPEQDENVSASGSPAGAVNVKLIPAIGPAAFQLLEVKNLGSPQTFRADCTLLQRRNDINQLHRTTFRMEWDHPSRRTSGKLPRGGSRNLIVAIADKVRGIDQGHLYEMQWIAINGLSGDYERKEIERTTWNYGEALPEYDLQITITSGDQEPYVECFTLRAGKTSAMEMFAIAGEQNAERGNDLPAARPIIAPKRYGKGILRDDMGYTGLAVVNDGEPAYDITISGAPLPDGARLAIHRGHTERLTKNDGEAFYPCFIDMKLGGTFGSGLFDFMRERGLSILTVPITYRDSGNCWFQTDITLERDVEKSGGLRLSWRQILISDPTATAGSRLEATRPRAVRKEVETLKLSPARIKVTTYELQRTIRLHGKEEGREIFLRAKVELLEPLHLTVTRYRMELSRDGVLESPEFQDDIEKWEITDWSKDPIPHDEMRPLPRQLTCGDPVEGWVHFVTERNNQELDRSRVRFFVDTPQGTGSAEISPDHGYWNVIPNRMIAEK